MLDNKELQRRIDWIRSRVAPEYQAGLEHELVWKDFPAGEAVYAAHHDIVWTYGDKETAIHVDMLMDANGRSAYWLLFDLRDSLGVKVDFSKWPNFAPPKPVLNPIGEPWSAEGPGAYHVVGNEKWQNGDVWEDKSGVYMIVRRRWAFFRYFVWIKQVA